MANRGHNVVLSSESTFTDSAPPSATFREHLIKLKTVSPAARDFALGNSTDWSWIVWENPGNPIEVVFPWAQSHEHCQNLLKDQLDEFYQIANQKWDMIFVDSLFSICGMTISHINEGKAQRAVFHTSIFEHVNGMPRAAGIPWHTNVPLLTATPSWTVTKFMDRIKAFWEALAIKVVTLTAIPYFITAAAGSVAPNLNYDGYFKDVWPSFIEYPPVLGQPLPKGLEQINVGSYCLAKPKPLPDDLESFVSDKTSKGTIVVAFGTLAKLHQAPQFVLRAFIEALSGLKDYRIIWQYGGHDPPAMPKHVKIMKWLPQPDLLLHNKTQLFVSHGGLKSVKEAICSKLPVVFLPLFGEQTYNSYNSKAMGFGEALNKIDINAKTMSETILKVLQNPVYRANAEKVSAMYSDSVISALDLGAFYAEYVMRHNGWPEIKKRRGADLYWFQCWCVDIFAMGLSILLLAGYLVICIKNKLLRIL